MLKKMIRGWVGSEPTGAKLYLTRIVLNLGVLSLFLSLAMMLPVKSIEKFQASTPDWIWLWIFLVLIVWVSTLFIPSLPKGDFEQNQQDFIDLASFTQNFGKSRIALLYVEGWMVSLGLFFVFIVALFMMIIELYARIPQEFGGVLPRHAYLDVNKAQLSKETIDEILPSGATESVVRSNRVEILFSGSEIMIIRSEKNRKVFSLAKSTILTVNSHE